MNTLTFRNIVGKSILIHTLSYFIVGVSAFFLADYSQVMTSPGLREYLRAPDHPLVTASMLFQPVRGFLFGLVFYVLRDSLFAQPHGWVKAWLALVVIGILSPFAPALGSVEGLIYAQIPLLTQLLFLPEILLQSLMLAYGVHYCVHHPDNTWLNRILLMLFIVLMGIVTAGLFAR